MLKQEFLGQLRKGLAGLPQADIEERLNFYNEMIEDRIEEGFSEEEAVAAAGSVREIVAQAVADTPLAKIAKERIQPKRRLGGGEILLLVLGSPIWLSLGIAVFSVILSVYVTLWSVIISLWAVFAAFIACSVGGIVAGAMLAAGGNGTAGVATLAAGVIGAGVAIFVFFGCRAVTNGLLLFTKKIAIWIKNCFMKKEETQ